jgi:hypothetical protein
VEDAEETRTLEPQDWTGRYSSATMGSTFAPPPPHVPRYDLRPLAAGEILDRVISIYRAEFWLLIGLSAVSAGVVVVIQILRLAIFHSVGVGIGSPAYAAVNGGLAILQVVLYVIAYSITVAATTVAVNAIYLNEPTSIGASLRTSRKLWLRCLAVAMWQGWSAMWLFLLLIIPFVFLPSLLRISPVLGPVIVVLGFIACGVYGVIAYLRNSLGVPAAVIENLGVRASMRRSKGLATGRIGRIFLLFVLVYALWMVAAVVQLPITVLALRSHEAVRFLLQAILLAVSFLSTSLIAPLAAIGLCLFYFDERVRREGFDIEVLLRGPSASSPETAAVATQSGPAVYSSTREQF